jgi:hypothetical protein
MSSAAGTRERLRWFGLLWMAGFAMDFTAAQKSFWVAWVLVVGLPALVRPDSLRAFGLLIAGTGVAAAFSLPASANHLVVALLAVLGLAASALWVRVNRGRRDDGDDVLAAWFEVARTPVGLTLLVVYAFTVFHKLNTAFFDPAVSCAGTLMARPFRMNPADLALDPTVVQIAAVGTVLVETAILVLLAVPRLRRWGLLTGIVFHLMLAPGGFWDFSTLVFALYLLLMPDRVFGTVAEGSARLRAIALAGVGVHLVLFTTAVKLPDTVIGPRGRVELIWVAVLAWYVAVVPFLVRLLRACFADRGDWPVIRLRPAVLLIVPLLAFLNGAAPYLGLKTVTTYSMFSNLHVEAGTSNHLVPGVADLQLTDYLRDTVTVTAVELRTDDRREALRQVDWVTERPPIRLPWLELRRAVAKWRDDGVTGVRLEFSHGGVTRSVDDALTDPELGAPLPWWQRRLLAFRAIDSADGRDVCRW